MTPEGEATRETRATSYFPEITSTTQDSFPLKNNKKSALAVKRGKEDANARAGIITGNNKNNHSNNAARAVRVAGGSRGGLTPESQPKNVNEEVPHLSSEWGGQQGSTTQYAPHVQIESNSCSK